MVIFIKDNKFPEITKIPATYDDDQHFEKKTHQLEKSFKNERMEIFRKKFAPGKSKEINKIKNIHGTIISSTQSVPEKKMVENYVISNRFYRTKLFEEILFVKRRNLDLSKEADKKLFYLQPLRFDNLPCVGGSKGIGVDQYLHNHDTNTDFVASLIQRLQRIHLREKSKFKREIDKTTLMKDFTETALFNFSINKNHVMRFGNFKMILERQPIVPTLLRAARSIDVYSLQFVFKKILNEGIDPEILNAQDISGRTALSYICDKLYLFTFLEILVQLPGIDVNKSDCEGSTPLHYASASGEPNLVKLLIMNSQNLKINVKNSKGITPLMKASCEYSTPNEYFRDQVQILISKLCIL